MLPIDLLHVTVDDSDLTRLAEQLWYVSNAHRDLTFDTTTRLGAMYVYRHAMINALLRNGYDPEAVRGRTFYRTVNDMHTAARRLYMDTDPNLFRTRYNPMTASGK